MIDPEQIRSRLFGVRAQVDAACRAAGRSPDEVTLIAVSKTHPPEAIRAAYQAGQRDFGENYAQELSRKREALSDLPDIRWHFIGALQSNKAKLVTPGCVLIHAVDRDSVGEALSRRAVQAAVTQSVLVEVNVGDEASKAGVTPNEAPELISRLRKLPGLSVRGLMCIPPPTESEPEARGYFARLRTLRDALQQSDPSLALLSMGMSGDFEAALLEGATHVRVGTAIFGERDSSA